MPKKRLNKVQKVGSRLDVMTKRVERLQRVTSGWSDDLTSALDSLGAALDLAREAHEALGESFSPPKKAGGIGIAKVKEGATVQIRDVKRDSYRDVMDANTMAALKVLAVYDRKVKVSTSGGETYILPRQHVKSTDAAA